MKTGPRDRTDDRCTATYANGFAHFRGTKIGKDEFSAVQVGQAHWFEPQRELVEMRWLSAAVPILALIVFGCSDDKISGGIVVDGDSLAVYNVTFSSTWSAMTHPADFPSNAHFSGLIGATHDDRVSFWNGGELASPGIQNMAETGSKNPLSSAIDTAIAAGTARFKLSGGGIAASPGAVSLEFTISTDHPLVSLVSMIAPSPDWFVGVSALAMRDANGWIDSLTVDLYGWDAGTDDGVTYASPNAPSMPHVPIFPLNDGIFKTGDSVPPLGTFTFTRQQ